MDNTLYIVIYQGKGILNAKPPPFLLMAMVGKSAFSGGCNNIDTFTYIIINRDYSIFSGIYAY